MSSLLIILGETANSMTAEVFLAISSILENKTVKYDIEKKKLVTDIEQSGPQTPQA